MCWTLCWELWTQQSAQDTCPSAHLLPSPHLFLWPNHHLSHESQHKHPHPGSPPGPLQMGLDARSRLPQHLRPPPSRPWSLWPSQWESGGPPARALARFPRCLEVTVGPMRAGLEVVMVTTVSPTPPAQGQAHSRNLLAFTE